MEDQSKKKPVKNSEKNNLAKKAMYKKKCVEQDYSDLIEIIKNYQKILSDDSFLMGAIKEMYEIQYLIVKKSSRNLLNQLFSCMTVSSAHDIAIQFINSLLIDNSDYSNIFDNPYVNSFLIDAPFFKLLFADNCNNEISQNLKKIINSDNTKEQHILYSVMNMSYFDCIKEIESAIDYINIDLEYSGFEKLNEENQFDSLIINCIKEENRINKENNLNLNIGGMRCLSRLINENKHFPEIIKD